MKAIEERWALILQASVSILGSIFVFVLAPPRLTPEIETVSWFGLAEVAGAILVVITLVGVRHARMKAKALQLLNAVLLIAALASFFAYRWMVGVWTCRDYDGRGPIVIGSKLLPDAALYYRGKPVTPCVMIQDSVGDTASLWPQSELLARHSTMAGLFLLTALLFLMAAIIAIELAETIVSSKQGDAA